MMLNYLAPIIPVRWFNMNRLAALACLCAASVSAQSLESLGASYRKTPNPRTRAALLRYANAHPSDKNGALALLALGATEVDERQFGDALKHLTAGGDPVSLDLREEAVDILNRAVDDYWILETSLTPAMEEFMRGQRAA